MVTFRVIYQIEGTENIEHVDIGFPVHARIQKENSAWMKAVHEALQYKDDRYIKLLALVRIA